MLTVWKTVKHASKEPLALLADEFDFIIGSSLPASLELGL